MIAIQATASAINLVFLMKTPRRCEVSSSIGNLISRCHPETKAILGSAVPAAQLVSVLVQDHQGDLTALQLESPT
jgi:hypothetical protein